MSEYYIVKRTDKNCMHKWRKVEISVKSFTARKLHGGYLVTVYIF